MELKERIIEATIAEFNDKGLKFTMNDVAKRLEISKKTIYTVFDDKENLILETIDYGFAKIKESEQQIVEDDSLDIVEKIEKIMVVLPDSYKKIDFRQIYAMQDKYPRLYKKIENRIESGWEATIELIEQGIAMKKIKPIVVPVLKSMVESSIEHFISSTILIQNNISYEQALEEMIQIIIDGIRVREE